MLAALRNRTTILLGRANPYRIKDEYRLLREGNDNTTLTFSESFAVNKETYISRFVLGDNNKCLGHRIGENVELEVDGKIGEYTPASRIDDAGFVDFVLKRNPAEPDSTSNLLIEMPVRSKVMQKGSTVKVKRLQSKWLYEGYGKFLIDKQPKQFRYVGLIAEGIALCNFFSLIEAVATNHDNTSLSLLWHCQSSDDFFLLQELNWFVGSQKLALNLIVEKPDKSWLGPIGRITERHLQSYMPYPNSSSVILSAGSKAFTKEISEHCQHLGFKDVHC